MTNAVANFFFYTSFYIFFYFFVFQIKFGNGKGIKEFFYFFRIEKFVLYFF